MTPPPSLMRGFSLLELLVAIAITTGSLLALYHASGGSMRAAAGAARQTEALMLAESLLALHAHAPPAGVMSKGVHDGRLEWSIRSAAEMGQPFGADIIRLHRLEVDVAWFDRGARRALRLVSHVPEAPQ